MTVLLLCICKSRLSRGKVELRKRQDGKKSNYKNYILFQNWFMSSVPIPGYGCTKELECKKLKKRKNCWGHITQNLVFGLGIIELGCGVRALGCEIRDSGYGILGLRLRIRLGLGLRFCSFNFLVWFKKCFSYFTFAFARSTIFITKEMKTLLW